MPTKEKGKALTWMNEKKSETDAQGLPKRRQQGREKRNSGMQKKGKRSNAKRTSRSNKNETKWRPGKQATPAPREAKTQKRQQCETHAHGRNKQETRAKRPARGGNGPRGQGLRNLHPGDGNGPSGF